MKRITKKEIKQFENKAIKVLTEYNAIKTENYGKTENWDGIENTYVCNTELFGKVYFCIELEDVYTYTVYVRFENENYMRQIKDFTGDKNISRKHNFCAFNPERVLVQLENFIEEVTITKDEFIKVFAS